MTAKEADERLVLLAPDDNVLVARMPIAAGSHVLIGGRGVLLEVAVSMGHKLARRAISAGEPIVKYGAVIGTATSPIEPGAHVHLHNVRSNYTATHSLEEARAAYRVTKEDNT